MFNRGTSRAEGARKSCDESRRLEVAGLIRDGMDKGRVDFRLSRAELNRVGLATRADRKVIDRWPLGPKFHGRRMDQ
jgi:hypothetical protein